MKERNKTSNFVIFSLIVIIGLCGCPNKCSGHGKCFENNCICFDSTGVGDGKSYTGSDCSLMKCLEGNPFSSVSSKYPVSNSVYSPDYRELSESVNVTKRELIEVKMELIKEIAVDQSNSVWQVRGIDELLKPLSKIGGVIGCKIGENAQENLNVDVLGVSDDKTIAYVKLASSVESNTKIICDKVISRRRSMVYVNSITGVVFPEIPAQSARLLNNNARQLAVNTPTLTWSYYGKIFKELGILTLQPTETPAEERRNLESSVTETTTYEKKYFRFACYIKPINDLSSDNPIKVISGITGTYTDDAKNTDGSIKFELSAIQTPKPSGVVVCNCLMNDDLNPINIEDTELSNFINATASGTDYKFRSYDNDVLDPNRYAVIKITSAVSISQGGSADINIAEGGNSDLIVDGREVYVDVYNNENGILSEESGTITVTKGEAGVTTTTIINVDARGIILPYIKTHASNPLIHPKPNIETKPIAGSTTIYKVYNLADKLIIQLDYRLGGILQCSYNDGKNEKEISVDVKGYETLDIEGINIVVFSYVEFSDEKAKDKIDTMKCSGISFKRKDFTMYNPMKLDTSQNGNYNEKGELTWKGYNTILDGVIIATPVQLLQVSSCNVNFACYTPGESSDKEITIYDDVKIEIDNENDENDIIFTIGKTTAGDNPSNGDICYLAAKFGDNVKSIVNIDKDQLSKSDLYKYIRKGEGEDADNYYYGKHKKPSQGIDVILDDENTLPTFVLDNVNNRIEDSRIIIKEKDIQSNDLEYLIDGQTILIGLIKEDETHQYDHKATITSSSSSDSRILSSDSTIIIPYSPGKPSGYKTIGTFRVLSTEESSTIDDTLDVNKYLYKVSYFYPTILNQLPLLGGKIQCKYVKTTVTRRRLLTDPSTTSIMGIVDVKGKIDYANSYIQFDYPVEKEKSDVPVDHYYIDDIVCGEIQSTRNDMSLLNPTKIIATGEGTNYDTETHILTWKGYTALFASVGFTLPKSSQPHPINFACYKPSESDKKQINFYEGDAYDNQDGNVKFKFVASKEPSNGDMCYLLTTSSGDIINIESSDLFDLVRKEEDGNYYFGKYTDVNDKTEITVQNEDGSIVKVLGKNKFSIDDKEDMIYIGKLEDETSPSISFPPSFIVNGIDKLMIVGTILKINGMTTQILKVRVKSNGKFELLLSNKVIIRDVRLLKNKRLLATTTPTSLEIIFSSLESIHSSIECSGQGLCDRESGICKCFEGYSGSACQRLDCPNNCNGNGRCVPLSELLSNDEIEDKYEGYGNKHKSKYKDSEGNEKEVSFDNKVYGCLCDKRHRGYDCSLIECPSGEDPEEGSNMENKDDEKRDCSGRGICNYLSGICECFDGFSGEGCQTMIQMM